MSRVGTFFDDLDTAQFITESPRTSPNSTPRMPGRVDMSLLGQTPRASTSFIYALMHRYDVNVRDALILFPDHLEPEKRYSVPLNLVGDWAVVLHALTRKNYSEVIPLVDASELNADNRDLQQACKKLWAFIHCMDFAPREIMIKDYNRLLATNREIRLKAFAAKNMCGVVGAKYVSVQYAHLTPLSDQESRDVHENGSISCCIMF